MFWSLKRYTGFLISITESLNLYYNPWSVADCVLYCGWQYGMTVPTLGRSAGLQVLQKSADTFLQSFGKWCDPTTIHQIWSVHFDILDELFGCWKKHFIQTIPSKPKKETQPCKVVIVDMNEDRIKRWNSDMAKSWAKRRLHLSAWSAGGSGWW